MGTPSYNSLVDMESLEHDARAESPLFMLPPAASGTGAAAALTPAPGAGLLNGTVLLDSQDDNHVRAKTAPEGAPADAAPATLRLIQITDVYMLHNFPSLRTLILEKRAELEMRDGSRSKTLSVLTGDFLSAFARL